MNIRKSIYRRCIPAALSATIAAGALTTPQEAEAAGVSDFVIGMAVSLVSMGITELGDNSVTISEESLQEIGDIVDAAISQAFLEDHMADANAAITQAELYVCSPGELPSDCATEAEAVFLSVDLAASHLEMTIFPARATTE